MPAVQKHLTNYHSEDHNDRVLKIKFVKAN